ncbi:MAG: arsenical pump-driving ATPase, partial [Nitrospirae bacterium]
MDAGRPPTEAAALPELLREATPFLLFTGKGGVGKTTLACASAIRLAEAGRRVLLVSTDPASNLSQVLEVAVGPEPVAVPGVPGLEAVDIDPQAAAAAYRERVVGPYRGRLPEAAIASMEEQLSGACTVEVAAFDCFTELLAGEGRWGEYDTLLFDTAPTGHTLRLLALPAAWNDFLATNTTGASCLGPASALTASRARYEQAVAALRDRARTTVVLVARPEASTLEEAARTAGELAAAGMGRQRLVVNGLFHAADPDDPVALAY